MIDHYIKGLLNGVDAAEIAVVSPMMN